MFYIRDKPINSPSWSYYSSKQGCLLPFTKHENLIDSRSDICPFDTPRKMDLDLSIISTIPSTNKKSALQSNIVFDDVFNTDNIDDMFEAPPIATENKQGFVGDVINMITKEPKSLNKLVSLIFGYGVKKHINELYMLPNVTTVKCCCDLQQSTRVIVYIHNPLKQCKEGCTFKTNLKRLDENKSYAFKIVVTFKEKPITFTPIRFHISSLLGVTGYNKTIDWDWHSVFLREDNTSQDYIPSINEQKTNLGVEIPKTFESVWGSNHFTILNYKKKDLCTDMCPFCDKKMPFESHTCDEYRLLCSKYHYKKKLFTGHDIFCALYPYSKVTMLSQDDVNKIKKQMYFANHIKRNRSFCNCKNKNKFIESETKLHASKCLLTRRHNDKKLQCKFCFCLVRVTKLADKVVMGRHWCRKRIYTGPLELQPTKEAQHFKSFQRAPQVFDEGDYLNAINLNDAVKAKQANFNLYSVNAKIIMENALKELLKLSVNRSEAELIAKKVMLLGNIEHKPNKKSCDQFVETSWGIPKVYAHLPNMMLPKNIPLIKSDSNATLFNIKGDPLQQKTRKYYCKTIKGDAGIDDEIHSYNYYPQNTNKPTREGPFFIDANNLRKHTLRESIMCELNALKDKTLFYLKRFKFSTFDLGYIKILGNIIDLINKLIYSEIHTKYTDNISYIGAAFIYSYMLFDFDGSDMNGVWQAIARDSKSTSERYTADSLIACLSKSITHIIMHRSNTILTFDEACQVELPTCTPRYSGAFGQLDNHLYN
jgi:hypothetical protein